MTMGRFLMKLSRRARALVHGDALDAELGDEIRLHLELETEDLMQSRGLSLEEARRQAMIGFGGVEWYREAQRDARGVRWIEQLGQDVRYGVRFLRKSPGFTVTSVLTIALGIGVTTVVFSVVDRLILHPLPFEGANRVVLVAETLPQGPLSDWVLSNDVDDWARHAQSIDAISMIAPSSGTLAESDHSLRVTTVKTSPSLFRVLHVRPILGRPFSNADAEAGAPRVMLLSEGFWQREFGGRQDVLGRRLALNDTDYTVVGVLPEQLDAARAYQPSDVWLPLTEDDRSKLATMQRGIQAIARLKPGVSIPRAEQELTVLMRNAVASPVQGGSSELSAIRLVRPSDFLDAKLKAGLWILFGATGLVLLIACANVANLQLVRAGRRTSEIALRAALGASRGRLVRQLFVESALLAATGGAAGILLGWWGIQAVVWWHPDSLRQLAVVNMDGRVVVFSLGLVAATSRIYGLLPAWVGTRSRLAEMLRGVSTIGRSGPRIRLQSAVVVGELALSLALLVGAGLLGRSFARMLAVDPGFRPAGLVELGVFLPRDRYADSTARATYWSTMLTRARAIPGVESAVPATGGMLQSVYGFERVKLEISGRSVSPEQSAVTVSRRGVPGDYFGVLGIPVLAGHTFSARDERGETQNVIISESMARRFWPGAKAIGKQFRVSSGSPWLTVMGVVRDVGLAAFSPMTTDFQFYQPVRDDRLDQASGMYVRVRPGASEAVAVVALRNAARTIDPRVPVGWVTAESTILDRVLATPRFNSTVMGVFAVFSMLLASLGLYGVVSYGVGQRTHEIGIRIAMGADARNVAGLIVGDGFRLALVGAAVGLAIAFAGVHLLKGLLYGVSPVDPGVFITIPLGLMAVALLASYLPARRAAKVDPVIALRAE